jgi:hypothetical protein
VVSLHIIHFYTKKYYKEGKIYLLIDIKEWEIFSSSASMGFRFDSSLQIAKKPARSGLMFFYLTA